MDCILNELSLNAQYDDIDDFSTYGVKPLSDVLRDVYSLGIGLLYKKSDFYNRRVTSSETFHDIIFSPVAKVNDYMRQMKSQLAKLQNGHIGMKKSATIQINHILLLEKMRTILRLQ